ncbi:MAG TPA: class I SAM-dependent methyltransferase [Gaiellaceae bacterium]|nr:class I SAM-dependent methyltransferase [Gaiellaceae bacterium]
MAESYERRRPSYLPELVDWVAARLALGPGKTVVDVAAGTGKLTRQLAATGSRVIAVEPLDEMRAQLEAAVPGAESLPGRAEALPLPDGSADAITVASAIHWFDLDRALPEFHRVLRPGGGLAVLGQGRALDDPLQRALQEIVGRYLPDPAEYGSWRGEVERSGLFGPPETIHGSFEQILDADGLAERIATISYIARLSDEERADVLAQVRAVGEAQPESPFPFRYGASASVCYAVS